MNEPALSPKRARYLHRLRQESRRVRLWQAALFVGFFAFWELSCRVGLSDGFLVSSPSRVAAAFLTLCRGGDVLVHVGVSCWETVVGFLLGTAAGMGKQRFHVLGMLRRAAASGAHGRADHHGDLDLSAGHIYNLWYVAESFLSLEDTEGRHWDILPTFEMLKEMMNSQLTSINHKAVYSADKAQVIVVENDPAITAVVEVVDPHLVAPILQYNHHLLHGQLNEKKRILLTLGSNLEARRSDLKAANSTLESDIFFILNSFDIRHNNREGSKKKDYIVNMTLSDLEYWYDNLFQMFLLAYLELDNLQWPF